jgi:hypothetical protein
MREDCKFFQSRTYPSGDVARFCALDLAPEAPWRCPEHCPRYEKRIGDAGFARGSMIEPAPGPEPELGSGVAALLDSAEEIINAAGPEIMAEQRRREQEAAARGEPWWHKLRRSPRWRR